MTRLFTSFLISLFLLATACNKTSQQAANESAGDTITTTATLLSIVEHPQYTCVTINDPWKQNSLMARYILIDSTSETSNDELPQGTIIKVPVNSSLVYSSVHAGAIEELGKIEAVTAVCDAQYYKIPEITARLHNGLITDAGASMSPSIERIIEHEPQIILTSPFQNAGHGAIEQLGIPIIECADYMESTPLGRAEWIKLIGRLYGNKSAADSIFNAVTTRYNNLREKARNCDTRPTIISEMVTDGVWYMPGGKSYMARIFADASASYPWSDDTSTGSLQLDFATVYDRANDAQFWFIKTFDNDLTLHNLRENYPLHERMSAFSNGGVYACNTASTTFFEDFPFHPDLLLSDFINIIHPGVLNDSTVRYYRQVK